MNALALFGAIDLFEVVRILVIIVIFFVIMIGKLMASVRSTKVPPVAGPQRPPIRPQQQPQIQVQTVQPKSVKEEIDEFLRRAAQKKQSQTTSGSPARGAFEAKQAPDAPTRRISQPSASISQRQGTVQQAETARQRPVGGAVSDHVSKYLDEKEFDQRASKLGGEVAAADSIFEQHLKEKFGHGLSQLAAKPGETAAPPPPPSTGFFQDEVPVMAAAGTGLAVLLNNIDNLRQAIVINEILQSPIDRWK
jgi:hypothetical protein